MCKSSWSHTDKKSLYHFLYQHTILTDSNFNSVCKSTGINHGITLDASRDLLALICVSAYVKVTELPSKSTYALALLIFTHVCYCKCCKVSSQFLGGGRRGGLPPYFSNRWGGTCSPSPGFPSFPALVLAA